MRVGANFARRFLRAIVKSAGAVGNKNNDIVVFAAGKYIAKRGLVSAIAPKQHRRRSKICGIL
jgi:hypothetical protein